MFRLVIKNSSGAVIGGREAKTLEEIQEKFVEAVNKWQDVLEVGDSFTIEED